MKKLFALLLLFVLIPCCVVAESHSSYNGHKMFKDYSTPELSMLYVQAEIEINYRNGEPDRYDNSEIHEMFSEFSKSELLTFQALIEAEREYRECFVNRMDFAVENGGFFLPENVTGDLIKWFLEDIELNAILISKDDGLYSGKERWWITLDNGERIMAFTISGMIEFSYGGRYFQDAQLYCP